MVKGIKRERDKGRMTGSETANCKLETGNSRERRG
jgi:hypothetical protein